ncbi:MAG: DNA polymerase/3'-5' exonuclease PolX [Acidobacteria bacterium]|nr:DNA polymerase/3'-5' exonuclease PolX [Acidobacteriota bacterium]
MINEEIADIFEKMSRVLAFKGANRFRALAYERAARSLRDLEEDLPEMAREGKLEDIPGIGKDLAGKIQEYIKTKRIRQCDQERRDVPEGLIALMDIPGLGPKTLSLLHEKYQIRDLDDLRRALDTGKLEKLRGFGKKKIDNIQRGINLWLARHQRMPLGIALPLAEKLLDDLNGIKQVERADIAGSLRRRRETIGDIDLLVISTDSPRALREFTKLPSVKQVIGLGDTRATVIIEGGIQVDVRSVARESYGAALQYFTGSKQHNIHLRTLAQKKGLKLNEYGVFRGEKRLGGAREDEVYRLVGVPVMPPELREDHGEIEAAMEGRLPKLVDLPDLRGDLHMHTNYSDGRATIAEMVEGAAALGYDYIALTDHSPSARIANGLDRKRLEAKIEELERVRKQRGERRPRILLGVEVDILADGRLDYPDEIIARCDVVVAAVHSSFRQSRDRMTKRLLDAIANPYVHILAHPLTRLMGSRDAVEFDFERIVEAAVEAGVALEVNAQPLRLDLTDAMARAAQEAGAVLAINTDAHSVAQLELIRYGVSQARRGWIEARSVVNSWPWTKFSRWLGQRRKRKSKAA